LESPTDFGKVHISSKSISHLTTSMTPPPEEEAQSNPTINRSVNIQQISNLLSSQIRETKNQNRKNKTDRRWWKGIDGESLESSLQTGFQGVQIPRPSWEDQDVGTACFPYAPGTLTSLGSSIQRSSGLSTAKPEICRSQP
jgi:hypothetical protein